MEKTYVIPLYRKEEMEKAIARFARKAMTYGKVFKAKLGEPYVKEVTVYSYDDITNTQKRDGTTFVECFDLILESDVIRLDGYSVVAKIEHFENANFVHSFIENPKQEWFKCAPVCQHCKTKHFRKNTFIVRNDDGTEHQIGSSCLKDYCGISPNVFASMRELTAIFQESDVSHFDREMATHCDCIYEFRTALAYAFDVVKSIGYVRSDQAGSNRAAVMSLLADPCKNPSNDAFEKADEMIRSISELKDIDNCNWWLESKINWLMNNMHSLVLNKYCKNNHIGFIAYAPVAYDAYKKALAEYESKKEENEQIANQSHWIGNVGDKIVFEVANMHLLTSWQNDFGRYTYLYKFVDIDGNVLIWYASHAIDDCKNVSAKVKSHSERDGVKQTVVAYCKAV